MKLLFMAFLAISTVRILSCRTVIENGRKIRQFVERHEKKTVEESLKLKHQEMERLKTEIDELEEQKTDENLQVYRVNLDEDVNLSRFPFLCSADGRVIALDPRQRPLPVRADLSQHRRVKGDRAGRRTAVHLALKCVDPFCQRRGGVHWS